MVLLLTVVIGQMAIAQQYALKPTQLAKIEDKRPSQIIEHVGYTVSYNQNLRIPNWVAYELTAEETRGTVSRKGNDFFVADPKANGVVVSYKDYSASGYDRGHMAPAGDMKWSQQAMIESFYLSNICPQNPTLNGGDWRILEEKIRVWAQQYGRIYIVCGPIMGKSPKTIGYNEIAVPEAFFKVLLRETKNGVEAIGFLYKNEDGHKAISSYMQSVDEIEKYTGIDFFYTLPQQVQKTAESSCNKEQWR